VVVQRLSSDLTDEDEVAVRYAEIELLDRGGEWRVDDVELLVDVTQQEPGRRVTPPEEPGPMTDEDEKPDGGRRGGGRLMAYEQVLVGTDGSSTANRAVTAASRVAAALSVSPGDRHRLEPTPARPAGALRGALLPPAAGAGSQRGGVGHETTTDAAAIARREGVTEIRQVQPIGGPAESLLRLADEYPNALLVVGTYGLTKRAERLVGNVPHSLTHHCPIDLLLTTAGDDPKWTHGGDRHRRLLHRGPGRRARARVRRAARCDGHPRGRRARRGPRQRRARPRGRGRPRRRRGRAPCRRRQRRREDPGRGHRRYDLLVIGNKGMSGPSRLLGSVANRVTHHVPTDLLLVNTTR
jgi:nucleotide-binding universal stress UspA family protein